MTTDATPSVQDTVAVPSQPCRTSDVFTSLRVAVTVMEKLATASGCADAPPTTGVALTDISTAGEKTNSFADEPPPVGVAWHCSAPPPPPAATAEKVFHSQPAGAEAMAAALTGTAEASELDTTAATPTKIVSAALGE